MAGKYDELIHEIMRRTKAEAGVLVIIQGTNGSGVSIREDFSLAGGKYHVARLPTVLRYIADQIEKDGLNGNGNGE